MREILFRGKSVNEGQWVEGYLYRISEKLNPFIMLKNAKGESYEVAPETVGQYTGMLDKNGTKIFEGDIIDFSKRSEDDGYGVVEYDADETEFEVIYDSYYDGLGRCYYPRDIEVVGNIYDNPELLEK